jgi:hypothetical protein
MTKEEILHKIKNFQSLSSFIGETGALQELYNAMKEYTSQDKDELIKWIEGKVKEYDAISESKTGVIGSYYLGKASGINEVKFFLSGLLTDNHSKQ